MWVLQQVWCCTKWSDKRNMHRLLWQKHRINLLFFAIVLGGLMVRMLFIDHQGLSNDELSAWARAEMPWSRFFEEQVKVGDMHPFFYQFLFKIWLGFFGASDWGIRSLSLVFYLLNAGLLILIAKKYFGVSTAIWALVFFAFSGFLIVNQSTSRPYNSGLFFVLLTLYYALDWIRNKELSKGKLMLISVSVTGAVLSHYFSGLTAAIIAFAILRFIPKDERKTWWVLPLTSLLLFLPHAGITWFQLNRGGLGWLDPPHWSWLFTYLTLTLQGNAWWTLLFLLLVFLLIWYAGPWANEQKFVGIVLGSIVLVSWGISVWLTPILRELVFQFIWPLISLFAFSFLEKKMPKERAYLSFVPLLFALSLIGYPLLERKHYGEFEALIQQERNFEKTGGGLVIENCISPKYLGFYSKQMKQPILKDWAAQDAPYKLAEAVRESQEERAMYLWTNNINLPIFWEIFRLKFPKIVQAESYFNAGDLVFSKEMSNDVKSKKVSISFQTQIKDSTEFLYEHKIQVKDVWKYRSDSSYFALQVDLGAAVDDQVYLVVTLNRNGELLMKNDQPVLYTAYTKGVVPINQSILVNAFQLPKDAQETDELKVYVWNQSKNKVEITRGVLKSYTLF